MQTINHSPSHYHGLRYQDATIDHVSGMFTYHADRQTIFAEASTISTRYKIDYTPGNILTIKNPKTGRTMSFILSRVLRDQDNTITKWIYNPLRASEAHAYSVNHLTIFND